MTLPRPTQPRSASAHGASLVKEPPMPKPPHGRPLRGETPRNTPIRASVEAWVKRTLLEDMREGESQADVLTRWAAERRK